MANEDSRQLVREGFGAIAAELRQRRGVDKEILKRLDEIIKLVGGHDAKIQAIREDHAALSEQVQEHERRLRLAAVPR